MPRGVVAQHATGTMSAVAWSPDLATGPTALWRGLPTSPRARPKASRSPEETFGRSRGETFGRRRGTVGRPCHSAVKFGNERSVLNGSSYP
jgi:hypothetical protein